VNTLLETSIRMGHHTDLRLVFEALGGRGREFNWLLTDLELNYYPPELIREDDTWRSQARWLGGAELTDIVFANDIQFIWGVLSGFRPGVAIDPAALDTYPFADGNESLWTPGIKIQHALADVEIVCWDSTATMLLTRDDDLTRRFREFFAEAIDLDEFNRTGAADQRHR
jgi:hypothetical protein